MVTINSAQGLRAGGIVVKYDVNLKKVGAVKDGPSTAVYAGDKRLDGAVALPANFNGFVQVSGNPTLYRVKPGAVLPYVLVTVGPLQGLRPGGKVEFLTKGGQAMADGVDNKVRDALGTAGSVQVPVPRGFTGNLSITNPGAYTRINYSITNAGIPGKQTMKRIPDALPGVHFRKLTETQVTPAQFKALASGKLLSGKPGKAAYDLAQIFTSASPLRPTDSPSLRARKISAMKIDTLIDQKIEAFFKNHKDAVDPKMVKDLDTTGRSLKQINPMNWVPRTRDDYCFTLAASSGLAAMKIKRVQLSQDWDKMSNQEKFISLSLAYVGGATAGYAMGTIQTGIITQGDYTAPASVHATLLAGMTAFGIAVPPVTTEISNILNSAWGAAKDYLKSHIKRLKDHAVRAAGATSEYVASLYAAAFPHTVVNLTLGDGGLHDELRRLLNEDVATAGANLIHFETHRIINYWTQQLGPATRNSYYQLMNSAR
ncbi:MAG TPA: hypothetical protein VLQ68_07975 [Rhizobiaceae bacterium]|nr:hypothetical protein [Rhizobiaceae bacterium]